MVPSQGRCCGSGSSAGAVTRQERRQRRGGCPPRRRPSRCGPVAPGFRVIGSTTTTTTTAALLLLVSLLLAGVLVSVVQGAPHLLLTSAAARCFQVDAPQESKLEILYNAPDLPLGGGGPDETKKEGGDTKPQVVDQVRAEELLAQQQQLQGEAVAATAGGLDTRYEERERRRMQGMAALAQNMKDTSILIFQRDPSGGMNPRMSALGKARNPGSGRVRHQLEKREGKVEYKTSASDGLVEICVQSFQAKPDNPSRISIRVIEPMESPSMYEEDLEDKIERQEEEKRKLSMHSSRIAAELDSFQKRMEELAKNADNSKDRELDFHGKSIALNKAVKYWPIFRIVVLVAAGYMQATNVIRYMKSKHIY